jgi:hypothetical protein
MADQPQRIGNQIIEGTLIFTQRDFTTCCEGMDRLGRAIFAKEKTSNGENETHNRVTKAHKGAKYGIPDINCGDHNDGALRADHSGLFETA